MKSGLTAINKAVENSTKGDSSRKCTALTRGRLETATDDLYGFHARRITKLHALYLRRLRN